MAIHRTVYPMVATLFVYVGNLFAQNAPSFKTEKAIIIESDKPAGPVSSVKKLIFLDFYNASNDANVKWLTDSIGESIFELTKIKGHL